MEGHGYRVTYKSRRSDGYTCTYRFPCGPGESAAVAFGRADQFRLAVIADGGAAEYPVPYAYAY